MVNNRNITDARQRLYHVKQQTYQYLAWHLVTTHWYHYYQLQSLSPHTLHLRTHTTYTYVYSLHLTHYRHKTYSTMMNILRNAIIAIITIITTCHTRVLLRWWFTHRQLLSIDQVWQRSTALTWNRWGCHRLAGNIWLLAHANNNSATPDLRLPSQLTPIPNLYCLVTVGCLGS